MSAMCPLSFEWGMETLSWYAELAFRSLVSMSATGSVIVMMDFLRSPGFGTRYASDDLWWWGPAVAGPR
jgi:hypothetical protein